MSRLIAVVCTFMSIGCSPSAPTSPIGFKAAAPNQRIVREVELQAPEAGAKTEAGGEALPGSPAPPAAKADNAIPNDRKIIFTGTLIVDVREFDSARKSVDDLLKTHKAYFTKTDITGDSGRKRSGTFSIKVPVEHFQKLIDELAKLGNPVRNQTDSQDVTEEYVDVASRIRNLKNEEEVLNKLLKDSAGRLEEVFRIREQIRNNRGEIEKAEGRLQALSKLTSFSTITLTLRETEDYVAPTAPKAPEAPRFAERANGTWTASLESLTLAGESIALVLIAIAPWLPFAMLVVFGIWLMRRRIRTVHA